MTFEIFEAALRLALHGHEDCSVYIALRGRICVTTPLANSAAHDIVHDLVAMFGSELDTAQTMFSKMWFFDLKR